MRTRARAGWLSPVSYPPPPMPPSQPPYGGQPPYGAAPPPPGGQSPFGGQAPYSAIGAVEYGWQKFRDNLGPFLLMGLIIFVSGMVIQFTTNLVSTGTLLGTGGAVDPETGLPEQDLIATLIQLIGGLVSGVIAWVLGLALMRGALDVVDTGRTDFAAMFTRIPWGQAVIAGILVGLALIGGLILCIFPVFIVGFLLYYSSVAVLDGESGPGALAASFRFTTQNLGQTLLFAVLSILLIVIVTCCTLGLGSIVVTPLFAIGVAYTWRTLQGRPVAP